MALKPEMESGVSLLPLRNANASQCCAVGLAMMTDVGTVVGEFFVPGRARTKGSLKPELSHGPKGKIIVSMVESGVHSRPWKLLIIHEICRQYGWDKPKIIRQRGKEPQFVFTHTPYPGPVEVRFEVAFDREYAVEAGLTTEELRDASTGAWPISIIWGDGDKLERNLWDALTQSGMIEDDRLSCQWHGRKRWTRPSEPAGLRCRVTALPEREPDDDWFAR